MHIRHKRERILLSVLFYFYCTLHLTFISFLSCCCCCCCYIVLALVTILLYSSSCLLPCFTIFAVLSFTHVFVCVWNINMFHGFAPFLYTRRLPHAACLLPHCQCRRLWPGHRLCTHSLSFVLSLLLSTCLILTPVFPFSLYFYLSLSFSFFGFVASCVFNVFVLCSWRVLIFYSAPYVTPVLSPQFLLLCTCTY